MNWIVLLWGVGGAAAIFAATFLTFRFCTGKLSVKRFSFWMVTVIIAFAAVAVTSGILGRYYLAGT